MATELKLFSGTCSRYLADKIAYEYDTKIGDLEVLRFSDGEMQPVINESARRICVFYPIYFRACRQFIGIVAHD
jgi:ribose-phosphate pyrophosphokinase